MHFDTLTVKTIKTLTHKIEKVNKKKNLYLKRKVNGIQKKNDEKIDFIIILYKIIS